MELPIEISKLFLFHTQAVKLARIFSIQTSLKSKSMASPSTTAQTAQTWLFKVTSTPQYIVELSSSSKDALSLIPNVPTTLISRNG
jgi:hypothetical protein